MPLLSTRLFKTKAYSSKLFEYAIPVITATIKRIAAKMPAYLLVKNRFRTTR